MFSGPEFGDMLVIVGVEANAGSDKRTKERMARTKVGMQRTLVKRESRCQWDFNPIPFKDSTDRG
jgi:hypothetical protein